jgi:hypothetical protein
MKGGDVCAICGKAIFKNTLAVVENDEVMHLGCMSPFDVLASGLWLDSAGVCWVNEHYPITSLEPA